eukprot:GEMP01113806.1.p1 GENE.GEMP01113806.1~~GEMP01113806.1.p1  ORF type:complete len:156 (-),score=3.62 GEMP01113806.1:13-480(-)
MHNINRHLRVEQWSAAHFTCLTPTNRGRVFYVFEAYFLSECVGYSAVRISRTHWQEQPALRSARIYTRNSTTIKFMSAKKGEKTFLFFCSRGKFLSKSLLKAIVQIFIIPASIVPVFLPLPNFGFCFCLDFLKLFELVLLEVGLFWFFRNSAHFL